MGPLRPNRPSDQVAGYLARNEHVVLEMKQHWARVLPAVCSCLAGLVLVIVAGITAPAWMGAVTNAAWWIWVVLLAHLAWRLIEWWDETFVITNKRLILVHGLFVKKVAMMPLSKVTDMSYNRSPMARILGYGTFVIESAGQQQALDVIDFVRDPDSKYREICGLIFGGNDEEEDFQESATNRGDDSAAWNSGYSDDETYVDKQYVPGRGHAFNNDEHADDLVDKTQKIPQRTRRFDPSDDTDPYGLITVRPRTNKSDPHHSYGDRRDVGEESTHWDDDSAWSVSREHATAPQTIRRSRHADTPSTWRDAE